MVERVLKGSHCCLGTESDKLKLRRYIAEDFCEVTINIDFQRRIFMEQALEVTKVIFYFQKLQPLYVIFVVGVLHYCCCCFCCRCCLLLSVLSIVVVVVGAVVVLSEYTRVWVTFRYSHPLR